MPALTRHISIAVLVALSSLAAPALGQSDAERAGARAAAEEGGQAFSEERYSDAVDLFERAESLVHSPVHLLYMARSLEKLGSLVRAREAYIKVAKESLAADAPPAWADAKASAQQELETLKPKIPYVTVAIEGAGAKPVTVLMDGVRMPPALVGVPHPVDPGEHKFEAVAEGLSSGPTKVIAQAGRREKVVLTLGTTGAAAVAGVKPEEAGVAPPTEPASQTPPADEPAAADEGGGIPAFLPWTVLGVGVVGVGLGTVFALSAKSSRDDLSTEISNNCRGSSSSPECPASLQSKIQGLKDDGDSSATVATVGFIVGGVGLAAGGALLFLAATQGDDSAKAGVHPYVGVGSAGVYGSF